MKRLLSLITLFLPLFFSCASKTTTTPFQKVVEGPTNKPKIDRPAVEFTEPTGVVAKTPDSFKALVKQNKNAIEQNPQDFDAYLRLGKAYRKLNQLKRAKRAFENATLVRPSDTKAQLDLASVHLELEEYTDTVRILKDLSLQHPKNWAIKNSLAIAYRKMGTKEGRKNALALIREMLTEDKYNIYAINNLGLLYYETQRYDLAELTFQKGKKTNEKTAETYNNLGLTYMAMGLFTNAISEFKKASQLSKSLVSSRLNMGHLFLQYGNYDRAIEVYREVLDIDPLHIPGNLNIGVAYLAKGEFSKARQAFDTILEMDSRHGDALYNLGWLYHQHLKDGEMALKYYERFLKSKKGGISKNHEVYNYIKQIRSTPKRPEVAPLEESNPKNLEKKGSDT